MTLDDLTDSDTALCHFPTHKQFLLECRIAELKAKRTGKNAIFWWRGYRGIVAPNLPPITSEGLEVRLMKALQKVNRTVPETMVFFLLIL